VRGQVWPFLRIPACSRALNFRGCDVHVASGGGLHRQPFPAGSVNENVAPALVFASPHSRPPWDSMIERLIDNPMPVPCAFVVKNASKM
jgi:hypothetical protein